MVSGKKFFYKIYAFFVPQFPTGLILLKYSQKVRGTYCSPMFPMFPTERSDVQRN